MSVPGNFEVRNAEAEEAVDSIGRMLREACPPGLGFALLLFAPGAVFYSANCNREDVIRAMQEFIAHHREH